MKVQVTENYLFEQIGRQQVEIAGLRQQLEEAQVAYAEERQSLLDAQDHQRGQLLQTIAELTERCDAPCEHCGVELADAAGTHQ